jgi:hypothetical protein
MGKSQIGSRTRKVLLVLLAVAMVGAVSTTASAITWKKDDSGGIAYTSGKDDAACPTFSTPPPFSAWFNIADMEQRGYWDGKDPAPWDYSKKLSQVICGAADGAHIEVGMYFARGLGTMNDNMLGARPETDPELMYDAMEWVHKHRDVSIGFVLEGNKLRMTDSDKANFAKRIKGWASVSYCKGGCMNTSSQFPEAVNHEKFLSISDTIWAGDKGKPAHPAILSLSGNFARSQLRWYHQEVSLVYDDHELMRQFDGRYDDMLYCAKTKCSSSKGFSKINKLSKQRGIWVDPFYRHYTDAGRGTTVSFSPQPKSSPDFYTQQFDDVDCAVDNSIRIAMFKLTESKAQRMADSLKRLKARGCDIKLLLTAEGGTLKISPKVVKILTKAKVPTKCVAIATHTKLILIGPARGNQGRALVGTTNMSTAGLRYNEDHILTFDTRRASDAYVESMRRLYSDYMTGWYEMSENTRSCS